MSQFLTSVERDRARAAAREVWDALVRLRQWAGEGASLEPQERQRPLGPAFALWLEKMQHRCPDLRKTLEAASDAVPPVTGRRVRFGHRVDRKALTILLCLLEEAVEYLGETPVVTGTAPRIFCELLGRKLEGAWDYLWLDLEEDIALIGSEDALSAGGAAPHQYVTLDQAAALVNRRKKTLERYLRRPKSKAVRMPEPDVEGTGGKPHEWRWDRLRPWLEKTFDKTLPERLPSRSSRPAG